MKVPLRDGRELRPTDGEWLEMEADLGHSAAARTVSEAANRSTLNTTPATRAFCRALASLVRCHAFQRRVCSAVSSFVIGSPPVAEESTLRGAPKRDGSRLDCGKRRGLAAVLF